MFVTRYAARIRLFMLVALALGLILAVRGFPTAAAEGEESATVVREITSERTATSKTFELSDGRRRAVLFEAPIHYRDAQGAWQDLDTTLVRSVTYGSLTCATTPATVTLGAQVADGLPVSIAYDDAEVGIDLLGTLENAPVALGDAAAYVGVAPATDLRYRVLPDGLKDVPCQPSWRVEASNRC